VARDRGDFAGARARFEECLALFRAFGDWPAVVGVGFDLHQVVAALGDSTAAGADEDGIAAYAREAGSALVVGEWLQRQAGIARDHGDRQQAQTLFQQSLVEYQAAASPRRIVGCLTGLANLSILAGRPERAARLVGAALGLCAVLGTRLSAIERGEHDRVVAAARAQLGEEQFQVLLVEGQTMTLDQAVAYALEAEA